MRKVFLIVAITLSGILVSPASKAGQPLESGTVVVFFLEASGNQPEPDPGPPTDMLLFTGGRIFSIELPGCSDILLSLHNAVLVDVNGPRSSRTVSVIAFPVPVAGEAVPIPPGTRLTSSNAAGGCISDGISYRKYYAVVE